MIWPNVCLWVDPGSTCNSRVLQVVELHICEGDKMCAKIREFTSLYVNSPLVGNSTEWQLKGLSHEMEGVCCYTYLENSL